MEGANPKRRAFRACRACRTRKVRCVVVDASQKCVNCKLDRKECDLIRIYQGLDETEQAEKPTTPSFATNAGPANGRQPRTESRPAPLRDGLETLASPGAPRPSVSSRFAPVSESFHPSVPGYTAHGTGYATHPTNLSLPSILSLDNLPNDLTSPNDTTERITSLSYASYSFLKAPEVQNLRPHDQEFLIREGCFVLPQREYLDEFVRHYFLHVHPMLPILDEAEFVEIYDGDTLSGSSVRELPMIVMQAMLFVSASIVSSQTIQALGFKDAHDAQSAFYRRAKLLYDFNCERSSVAISQAALLLSHSHLTPLDHTESAGRGAVWLNVAIFQAKEARAHQYHLMPIDDPGGGPSINCLKHLSDEFWKSKVYNATTKSALAEILTELVQLCVLLTDLITVTSSSQYNTMPFVSPNSNRMAQVKKCKSGLKRWRANALRLAKQLTQGGSLASSTDSRRSLTLFLKLLDIYYYSATMALCHHEMAQQDFLAASRGRDYEDGSLQETGNQVEDAVYQLSECMDELTRLRIAQWLPLSIIGCTAFPLALQAFDRKLRQNTVDSAPSSQGIARAHDSHRRIDNLVGVVDMYRPRYAAIEWVLEAVKYNAASAYCSLTVRPGGQGNPNSRSWAQILRLNIKQYLYLVTAMDFSISKGNCQRGLISPEPTGILSGGHIRNDCAESHGSI
ncbi:unnamed protein product [Parascedosporium putredinis]|uniref:Zn(2)-C6 fungal-type domain-containing protein n=1 Tax=Parascedosporium putredinis TaxID=1442378 RepID=A0A9P1H082_9PEZI|nr:unnamed protein product [Parascedosporium putredinis]CAI7992428.1 unnamed protein product [Parascedosporium putredinis]